ncbi:hypothetical protein [Scytonema sp. PRP1]|uniref:hypothetical protein n=1 Tax=Scytonema sp. PRP1 TaxID=3120513 RepID=UPI002FD44D93
MNCSEKSVDAEQLSVGVRRFPPLQEVKEQRLPELPLLQPLQFVVVMSSSNAS